VERAEASVPAARSATLVLYGCSIFVGAALVFLLEPMVGKMLLPLLGGAAAVWLVTLVFFQAVLLGGYAFAHVSTRLLGVRRQTVAQLLLVLLPLPLLPVALPAHAEPPAGRPTLWLLGLLAVAAGLPFFVVTTASPVLQRWFAASGEEAGADPYFLYAAGNAGSLLALLAYPFLIEPRLTLDAQAKLWSAGYGLFVVLLGLSARRVLAADLTVVPAAPLSARIPGRTRLRWIAMAAVPSSLMLGTTSYLSTDIASVPLLWVVPLALYLLSFVVAFARRQRVSLRTISLLAALSALTTAASILRVVPLPVPALVAVHASTLFLLSLLVHRRLAEERPPADRLTEFYLLLSLGGVVGGIFNALLAPQLFSTILEYPLAIAVALLLRPRRPGERRGALLVALVPALLVLLGLAALASAGADSAITVRLVLGAAVLALVLFVRHRAQFAVAVGALFLLVTLGQSSLHTERTFYGVLRVVDGPRDQHVFVHGTTIHGIESFAPGRRGVPLSYYSRRGPIGQVFATLGSRFHDVGAVGLGSGALAAYGRPGDRYTFYELDPAVARIASDRRYFTFLDDSRASIRLVIGDGRLRLAAAPAAAYDLIVLDAFSSDSVPVHLLTREAVELYLAKLRPGGVLAFHVTNRYLDLEPVVAGAAHALGLAGLSQSHHVTAAEERAGETSSRWIALARDRTALARLAADPRWRPLATGGSLPLWTDQFSNVLDVLDWRS
jgi:SAM-dependent methyltransferase